MLLANGYGESLIGRAELWQQGERVDVYVYSADLILKTLQHRDGMSYDEAMEYFCFNIGGAYVGKHTPVFVWDDVDQLEELMNEDD